MNKEMIYEINIRYMVGNIKVDMHSNSSSYNLNNIYQFIYASNYGDIINSYNSSVIKKIVYKASNYGVTFKSS